MKGKKNGAMGCAHRGGGAAMKGKKSKGSKKSK